MPAASGGIPSGEGAGANMRGRHDCPARDRRSRRHAAPPGHAPRPAATPNPAGHAPSPADHAPRAAFLLVVAVALADLLLYGHEIGFGFVLFLGVLPVLAGLAATRKPTLAAWTRALAVELAALMPLVEQANTLTVLVGVAGTFFACLWLQGTLPDDWGGRVLELLVQAALAPLRWLPVARGLLRPQGAGRAWATALRWALPGAFALVFVLLFADANPLVERALAALDIEALLSWLFSERALFWLAMMVFAAPFLRAGAPWAAACSWACR